MSWNVCCVTMAPVIRMSVSSISAFSAAVRNQIPVCLGIPSEGGLIPNQGKKVRPRVETCEATLCTRRRDVCIVVLSSDPALSPVIRPVLATMASNGPSDHTFTHLPLFQHFCCHLPNPFGRFLEKKTDTLLLQAEHTVRGHFPQTQLSLEPSAMRSLAPGCLAWLS